MTDCGKMVRTVASTLSLVIVLIFFPFTGCWEAPWFCHGCECPMYTLVHEYEGFEERYYNTSHWITTDILSASEDDVGTGFWKLYYFNHGENKEEKVIAMTRPVVLSIKEADGMGEGQVSISVYQPDPNIPEPNDETIKVIVKPGTTVYVRSFGGSAKYEDVLKEVQNLKENLKAAGKQFIENKFDAAGYDAPWELVNRHNEIWVNAL